MKQSEVVWIVAQHAPVTVNEIVSLAPHETDRGNVASTVTDVWRDGLLLRREKEDSQKTGATPYEYAIRPLD